MVAELYEICEGSGVLYSPDADAGGGVAMAASINQAHIGHRPVVTDRVLAGAVRAVRA